MPVLAAFLSQKILTMKWKKWLW